MDELIEYYTMYEAKTYEGIDVWIGIHPTGVEILSLTGDIITEYSTTTDPRQSLQVIN